MSQKIIIESDQTTVPMGGSVIVQAHLDASAERLLLLPFVNGRRWGAHERSDAQRRVTFLIPLPNPGPAHIQVIGVPIETDHWMGLEDPGLLMVGQPLPDQGLFSNALQLTVTRKTYPTEVENYPGFPEGLTGPELVEKFRKQAERFGARVEIGEAEVDFGAYPFRVKSYDKEYQSKSIIIATGASPRKLGVPGEAEFTGRGVSYCATCDGFFFRDKEIAVVGGGDSALEEGVFLTKFAKRVRIIHRRSELRAGPALQERARRNEKIEFIWNSIVTGIDGDGLVESVQLRNIETGKVSTLKADGVFIYVGHSPPPRGGAGRRA